MATRGTDLSRAVPKIDLRSHRWHLRVPSEKGGSFVRCPPVDLAALEIGVFTGVGHRREYLGQRAALGTQQGLLEDFPMLLFGAVIAPGGALLERPHDGIVDVANHELSHVLITSSC